MLNTRWKMKAKVFANISIPFLRSCSHHSERDLWEGIQLLAKLVFSFSIIVFNKMKLLVILFIITLIAQINTFKELQYFETPF